MAASIALHDRMDPHQAGYIWVRCIRDILKICSTYRHSQIYFDKILADPVAAFNALPPGRFNVTNPFKVIQPVKKQFHASSANLPDQEIFTLHQQVFNELQYLVGSEE